MASSSDEDINPSDFLIHSLVEGAEAEQIAGQVVADVQDVVPEGGRHVWKILKATMSPARGSSH
jgi:hypothetical protein